MVNNPLDRFPLIRYILQLLLFFAECQQSVSWIDCSTDGIAEVFHHHSLERLYQEGRGGEGRGGEGRGGEQKTYMNSIALKNATLEMHNTALNQLCKKRFTTNMRMSMSKQNM